jgi:hypothetical protein
LATDRKSNLRLLSPDNAGKKERSCERARRLWGLGIPKLREGSIVPGSIRWRLPQEFYEPANADLNRTGRKTDKLMVRIEP